MSQNFHTPIPFAAAANAATFNSPNGQLDQAITDFQNGVNAFTLFRLASATTKTIASGAITVDQSHHLVDTEGAAGTDDLTTINQSVTGDHMLWLSSVSAARVVTIKHNTGNIYVFGQSDITLDHPNKIVLMLYNGTSWLALGAPAVTMASITPQTTKGDLIGYTTTPARIAVGDNDELLFADSAQASGLRWGQVKRAVLEHVEANNTAGGESAGGAWTDRTLNTVVEDTNSLITSLSGNQFTPVAGIYRLWCESAHVAATSNGAGRLRLYNVTAASEVKQGINHRMVANQGVPLFLKDVVFTANGSDAYAIQYFVNTGRATNGLGIALNSGESERYAQVILEKIG